MWHRRLSQIVFLLALAFASFGYAYAQTEPNVARKVDEFGDIQLSDLKARLDNIAIELMTAPTSKAFLVVYRTQRDLPGLSHSLAMRMKQYLVQTRGLPRDRVVIVDGGVAEHLTQEMWIVPPGTTPTPRPDARTGYVQNPDSAWKFFEQAFLPASQYRKFGLENDRELDAEYLEAYANAVSKNPTQSACIVIYGQYNRRPQMVDWSGNYESQREARLDPRRTARNELNRQRNFLVNTYGIPASKIILIDGGYRKRRAIEFWIVPAGEPAPVPTPNAFPFGRKRRR